MELSSLCRKIEATDYPPLDSETYSSAFQSLVGQCIQKDPSKRPDAPLLRLRSQA
ncbi:Serine/threonineprotein kinase Nek7like, partial [Caligus rogercresseyi]